MSIRFFPEHLQNNASILAFSKVLDYLFKDSIYSSGSLSLPNIAPSHTPLFNSIDSLLLFNQLESGDISDNELDKLAEMFNIAGYEYVVHFTSVVAEIRAIKLNLVRFGLYLQRIKGTPKSIQLVLEKFGYTNIVITENVDTPINYDNSHIYDGDVEYLGNLKDHLFSIDVTADHSIDDTEREYIIALINSYKKYRTELYQLTTREPAGLATLVTVTTVFQL